MKLHKIFAVYATAEPGTFEVDCEITNKSGERYRTIYASREEDPFGLAPAVRAAVKMFDEEPKEPRPILATNEDLVITRVKR